MKVQIPLDGQSIDAFAVVLGVLELIQCEVAVLRLKAVYKPPEQPVAIALLLTLGNVMWSFGLCRVES